MRISLPGSRDRSRDDEARPPEGLPELPRYPATPEALAAPERPSSWLSAVPYALRTVGLGYRLRRCRETAERRHQVLTDSREDQLVAIGRYAWDHDIPTAALAAHRAAIERAKSESADLEGQVAALEAAFAEERASIRSENETRARRCEGWERQYGEKDRRYQSAAREALEATGVLRDVERELADNRRSAARMKALPVSKRRPDFDEDVAEVARETATLESELPTLRDRVVELNLERDRQREEIAELRVRIRVERAAIETSEKALAARQEEVEGQKAVLRGAIAGAEAGLRGPLAAAGAELEGRREDVPPLAPWFASLDRHDAALASEDEIARAYGAAEEAYVPGATRRGWMLLGAGIAVVAVLVLAVSVLASRGGPTVIGRRLLDVALPAQLDAVLVVDGERVAADPVLRQLTDALATRLEQRPAFAALAAAGADLRQAQRAAVGLRFPAEGPPRALVAIEPADPVDRAELQTKLGKAGYEERTAVSGATRFARPADHVVVSGGRDVLWASRHGLPLLEDSPLLRLDAGTRAPTGDAIDSSARAVDRDVTLWAAAAVPAGWASPLGLPAPTAELRDHLALSLATTEHFGLHLRVVAATAERAATWEEKLRALLGGNRPWLTELVARVPALAAQLDELRAAMDAVTFARTNRDLDLFFSLPRASLEALVERIAPMLPAFFDHVLR